MTTKDVQDQLRGENDSHVDQFEAAWRQGKAPKISEFLQLSSDPDYHHLIIVLDLEFRWQRFAAVEDGQTDETGFPKFPRVEDYAAFSQVDPKSVLVPALVAEEYRVRSRWGDQPDRDEYQRRFPGLFPVLTMHLDAVDFERQMDVLAEDRPPAASSSLSGEPTVSQSDRREESTGKKVDPAECPRIGKYQTVRLLGRGGFGEVWLAEHPTLNHKVAIKIPRRDRQFPQRQLDDFAREGQKLAAVSRIPGIVNVLDADRHDGVPYLVSEFIEGETLADRLKRGPVPHRETVAIVAALAKSLHRAHLRGLTHRDIKPANILLDKEGVPYLADFGLAATEYELLREGSTSVGTIGYMAPEQARGDSHLADSRTDIYSLGVVLYKMLTGRLPFVADTWSEYLRQIAAKEPRPPRTIDDQIPGELERICLKCLSKPIAGRYTTADDLARDLLKWDTPRPVLARSAKIAIVIAALLVLALAVVFWRSRPPSNDTPDLHAKKNTVKPIAIFSSEATQKNFFQVNETANTLQLFSHNLYLVKLGRLDRSDAVIRVTITDISKTGEAGIFLGFRNREVDGLSQFQLIKLVKRPDGKVLSRRAVQKYHPHDPGSRDTVGYSAVFMKTGLKEQNTVEFRVAKGRLTHVYWNGALIEEVKPADTGDPEVMDITGLFGVYADRTAAEFSHVEINEQQQVFDRPQPQN